MWSYKGLVMGFGIYSELGGKPWEGFELRIIGYEFYFKRIILPVV